MSDNEWNVRNRQVIAEFRANGGKMTMKGCVSLFCRTVTWTKMS